jgi:hypothetical protein
MKYPLSKIITSGLFVGTLDITAACIQYFYKTGNGPAGVLKFVASGVFGANAFTSGNSMLFWGLLFHFVIAIAFTFFFFLIYPWLQQFITGKILTGILYGVFTWVITTQVIVRLSNTAKFPFNIINAVMAASILIVCIGIPLAYIAGSAYKK